MAVLSERNDCLLLLLFRGMGVRDANARRKGTLRERAVESRETERDCESRS
jgi:hypothetical protein